MRFFRTGLSFALVLAAACGTGGGNSSTQWNSMLDPTAHDSFFPIVAGSAHALGSDSPAITCNSCHGGGSSFGPGRARPRAPRRAAIRLRERQLLLVPRPRDCRRSRSFRGHR